MEIKQKYIDCIVYELSTEVMNFTFDDEYPCKEFTSKVCDIIELLYSLDINLYDRIHSVLDEFSAGVYNCPSNEQFYRNDIIHKLSDIIEEAF